jgi:hypothetical protein
MYIGRFFLPVAAALAATALLGIGCSPSRPDAATFSAEIYRLGESGKWGDAMTRAKQLALAYPEQAGAHYLLGKAYLHRPEPHLVQAEGELKTASALLARNGKLDAVAWGTEPEFELALRRDLALVDFRWIREAMRFNLPATEIRNKLIEARAHVEAGLKIDPEDAFLGEMRGTIEKYLTGPFKNVAPAVPPLPDTPAA